MQTVCLYSPFPTRATLVGAPPVRDVCKARGVHYFLPPSTRGLRHPASVRKRGM